MKDRAQELMKGDKPAVTNDSLYGAQVIGNDLVVTFRFGSPGEALRHFNRLEEEIKVKGICQILVRSGKHLQ